MARFRHLRLLDRTHRPWQTHICVSYEMRQKRAAPVEKKNCEQHGLSANLNRQNHQQNWRLTKNFQRYFWQTETAVMLLQIILGKRLCIWDWWINGTWTVWLLNDKLITFPPSWADVHDAYIDLRDFCRAFVVVPEAGVWKGIYFI